MKELSLKELILINGGKTTLDDGTLPEVVVVGHKKTFWRSLLNIFSQYQGMIQW